MKILLIYRPGNYFNLLGKSIADQIIVNNEVPDLVHLFAKDIAIFKKEMKVILKLCKKNPAISIWISWYKKRSGLYADFSENIIHEFGLQNNLVDVKVCAVSKAWSRLKLVVPVAKR